MSRLLLFLFRSLRAFGRLVLAVSLVLSLLIVILPRAQDWPWTPLRSLDDPIGPYTAAKLAGLASDPRACRSLLVRAGAPVRSLPPLAGPEPCRVTDPVAFTAARRVSPLLPVGIPLSCPLAAALVVWTRQVVEPAARAAYGHPPGAPITFGSYNCRRIAGATAHNWSEHARANAIDVAGWRLASGSAVTVASGWRGAGRDALFLHRVRDGACRVFATTLSPDYNAAHRDHLHLDEAERGAWGWRACR